MISDVKLSELPVGTRVRIISPEVGDRFWYREEGTVWGHLGETVAVYLDKPSYNQSLFWFSPENLEILIEAQVSMDVHYTSKSAEWETPQSLFDKLAASYGPFTLDPCATPENAKCERFFTEKIDGLTQSWENETVFCNPPYGRVIGKWIKKAYLESQNGAKVVCLIPARTDTAYWHDYVMKAHEIILLRGRVRFVGGKSCAPFPSAVVVFKFSMLSVPQLSTLDVRKYR